MTSRRVLVIVGTTASGKTIVSLITAERLHGEIISADSRQVYKFMDIGTAKPTKDERSKIRHYFVDDLPPDQDFNAGEFGKRGRELIHEIFGRRRQPVVVGGSGLYVQSLIDGFFEGPARDQELRKRLYERLHNEGAEALLRELRRIDPVSAAKILPSNTRRIVRALEVYQLTGTPISQHHRHRRVERTFEPIFVGLGWDRKALYRRIDDRVDRMIESGLVEEVKSLQRMGYDASLNALQTVGYQEVFLYLDGKITERRMVESIKQNSRRFAKRQLTWFRRDKRTRWFSVENERSLPDVAERILNHFRGK